MLFDFTGGKFWVSSGFPELPIERGLDTYSFAAGRITLVGQVGRGVEGYRSRMDRNPE